MLLTRCYQYARAFVGRSHCGYPGIMFPEANTRYFLRSEDLGSVKLLCEWVVCKGDTAGGGYWR